MLATKCTHAGLIAAAKVRHWESRDIFVPDHLPRLTDKDNTENISSNDHISRNTRDKQNKLLLERSYMLLNVGLMLLSEKRPKKSCLCIDDGAIVVLFRQACDRLACDDLARSCPILSVIVHQKKGLVVGVHYFSC